MAEKTEKKSGGGQIIKLALVLFAVSAIMALALGLVNELTKDTIAMRAAETTKKAYANVLAADEYTEQADFENDGTITKLSTATTGGQPTGYVAETTFSGAQATTASPPPSPKSCTGSTGRLALAPMPLAIAHSARQTASPPSAASWAIEKCS